MKKIFFIVTLLVLALSSEAQPRAIGARLGYGLDFSYQHYAGGRNMLEANLGLFGFRGIKIDATYNWVFPITSWTNAGSWNWYAGVGAAFSGYWKKDVGNINFGIAGKVGVEYNFSFPLQLFADITPVIGPTFTKGQDPSFKFLYLVNGIGIGARYRF